MTKNIWTKEEFPVDLNYEIFKHLNKTDDTYANLLLDILEQGLWKQNRTGTRTISIFGPQVKFSDVGNRFPLLTTKKVHLKSDVINYSLN
jgi:thymidylate synthase